MSRVRLAAATFAIVIVGFSLAGCSSSSESSWLQSKPPVQALQFESAPPGADVRTTDGQTCKTPCSLWVPRAAQQVNFALNGYLPQTVAVDVHQDNVFSPTVFVPNPVSAMLQAEPKPVKSKSHKVSALPKPKMPKAAAKPAATGSPSIMAPEPTTTTPQDSAFPPPPSTTSPVQSRFPPMPVHPPSTQ
jgi:hypothetical protein